LNQINIIAATASPVAMMEPITMPAIAPTGKSLPFPICEGGDGIAVVELGPIAGVALTKPEADCVLLGVMVGIGPFAGFISLAYSDHEGFLYVECPESVAQPRLRNVPRP
jgi:hypothetical protein